MGSLRITATRSRIEDVGTDSDVRMSLGATTIYAPSETILQMEVEMIADAIYRSAAGYLSMTRNVLGKLSREKAGIDRIERRLFGAVLGRQLRLGRLESIVCSSIHGKLFRVFVNSENVEKFRASLATAREILWDKSVLQVQTLEKEIFGRRSYNTWSSSSHLLARLVYMGVAEQIDKYSVLLTPGFKDGLRPSS